MSQFDFVFFDMDGCLVDSERIYCDAWLETFQKYNIPIDYQTIMSWRGLGFMAIVDDINQFTNNREFAISLKDIRDELFWEKLAKNEVHLKAYALDFMKYLDDLSIPYACVTSTFQYKAERILKHFELHDRFQFIVYGDQVENTKPFPDVYLKAIELSKMDRHKILVFEDSYNGMLACNRADLKVVYIPDMIKESYPDIKIFAQIESFESAEQWFD